MATCTPAQYIRNAATLQKRIDRTEALIDLLLDQSEKIIENSGILEYEFDDTQVNVKTKYTSASDLSDDIAKFERMLQNYINQLNGRATISRNINSIYRR